MQEHPTLALRASQAGAKAIERNGQGDFWLPHDDCWGMSLPERIGCEVSMTMFSKHSCGCAPTLATRVSEKVSLTYDSAPQVGSRFQESRLRFVLLPLRGSSELNSSHVTRTTIRWEDKSKEVDLVHTLTRPESRNCDQAQNFRRCLVGYSRKPKCWWEARCKLQPLALVFLFGNENDT